MHPVRSVSSASSCCGLHHNQYSLLLFSAIECLMCLTTTVLQPRQSYGSSSRSQCSPGQSRSHHVSLMQQQCSTGKLHVQAQACFFLINELEACCSAFLPFPRGPCRALPAIQEAHGAPQLQRRFAGLAHERGHRAVVFVELASLRHGGNAAHANGPGPGPWRPQQ